MMAMIGEILPLALGIAVSPIPIIAVILMLMSPRARSTAVGFLTGWLGGIIVAATVFTLLSSFLPEGDDGARPIRGIIHLALGVLLLFVAARQWKSRPKNDEQPDLPKWMQAVDSMAFGKALGLAVLLVAVNPKNLVMSASAGLAIGSAGTAPGVSAAVVVIFTVLAGATVWVPVVGFLLASERLRAPLEKLRIWLVQQNSTIMSILLLVLAVNAIGKGLGSF
ncbi:GAP family protein [Citricoccus sp.]|uniref:GAP family protein n=1 Tax=Citricoccus sp. TaxID=1978372 RepID=UPI0028BD805B|nr:GAP family protein [Citricoccus sp.]